MSQAKKMLEKQSQDEAKRKRKKVKTEFYPLLLQTSKNVNDAKTFCEATAMVIRNTFNAKVKDIYLRELDLRARLNKDDAEFERFDKLIAMFEDETLFNALDMLEGMPQAIESFIKEEMANRKLETLKEDLLD